jgi:hypothetical protein
MRITSRASGPNVPSATAKLNVSRKQEMECRNRPVAAHLGQHRPLHLTRFCGASRSFIG